MPIIVRYDKNQSARAYCYVEESCEHKMSSSEEDEVKENLVEEAYHAVPEEEKLPCRRK